MKGVLQYSSTAVGPFTNCGTVLTMGGQDYKVEAITMNDREDSEKTVGYRVIVQARLLELDDDFLSQNQWFFRIAFPDNERMILLGFRHYTIDYDALLQRQSIEYYLVGISFTIAADNSEFYVVHEELSGPGLIFDGNDWYEVTPLITDGRINSEDWIFEFDYFHPPGFTFGTIKFFTMDSYWGETDLSTVYAAAISGYFKFYWRAADGSVIESQIPYTWTENIWHRFKIRKFGYQIYIETDQQNDSINVFGYTGNRILIITFGASRISDNGWIVNDWIPENGRLKNVDFQYWIFGQAFEDYDHINPAEDGDKVIFIDNIGTDGGWIKQTFAEDYQAKLIYS